MMTAEGGIFLRYRLEKRLISHPVDFLMRLDEILVVGKQTLGIPFLANRQESIQGGIGHHLRLQI
jgi:hypothetical protein